MINYTESFNFKPIPAITPLDGYSENSTWKFNMPEITVETGTSPSWQDIILSGTTALTLTNALANGLNYLKLFGGTEQRNLPSGHQQLDYLQGDGTAYIETDVEPTNNTGMKIVFEYATSGSAATSGIYDGVDPRQDTFFISTNTGSIDTSHAFCAHRGATLSQTSAYSEAPVSGKTYTININYKNSGTMGIEGFAQAAVGTENVLTNKVLLFARLNYSNNNITASADKIKYVEFTEGTEVIRKYYPDSYNNELGLYDTITNTFLTNKNSTGTFTAGANVTTPSPDIPMDIVCNNGVVKVRNKSGLPLGYTLLDYIESTGTQYINTGVTDVTNSEFEVVAQQTSITGAFPTIMGALDGSADYKVVCGLSTTNNTFYSQLGGATGFIVSSVQNDTQKHTFKVITTTNQQTLQVDDTAVVVGDYAITSTTGYSLTICARNKDTVSNFTRQKVFSVRIKKSGVLVRNFVPAKRNSDNVLGMYDLVSGQFFTNAGTGIFTAGQDIDDIEIYTDGTVETVEITGKNLFDSSAFNTDVGTDNRYVSYQIPNGTYTMSTNFPPQTGTYYTNVWILAGKVTSGIDSTTNGVSSEYPRTITVTDGWYTVCYRSTNSNIPRNPKDYEWQLETGSTPTAYEPYTVLSTATAEMLLKVGDYKDVQEVLTGGVTRNIGIKVLDGTENWTAYNGGVYFSLGGGSSLPATTVAYCSHFSYAGLGVLIVDLPTGGFSIATNGNCSFKSSDTATQADWVTWLTDQYNAGTPVIVVYPLVTATTESVTAQPLNIQEGTNIVEITEASMDNLGLEVSFKQSTI